LVFLMMISAIMEMVGIGAIPAFILVVASPDKLFLHPLSGPVLEWLGIDSSRQLLVVGSVGLIGFFVVKGLLNAFISWVKIRFLEYKFRQLSHRLFSTYMRMPYSLHLQRNSSELLRNVNHETNVIVHQVLSSLLSIILSLISMVLIVALLIAVEPLFSILALVGLGGLSWGFMMGIRARTDRYGQDELLQRKISNKVVLQGIGGLKEIRVLGTEQDFLDQYEKSMERRSRANFFRSFVTSLQRPVFETITVAGVLGLALVLTMREESIESIIAVLALFAAATYRLMPVFRDLLSSITTFRYSVFSVDPVFDDLEDLAHVTHAGPTTDSAGENAGQAHGGSAPSAMAMGLRSPGKPGDESIGHFPFRKEIAFEGVSYTYPAGSGPALKNVNLRIPRGKAVALVGESGAGKTTLVDAMLGLLEIQQGTIRVDGRDIFSHTRAWQRQIGYIPQFIYLCDDSLLRNVALGIPERDIDMERFRRAAEMARLTEVVNQLPDKEHTVLGERGVRLSGGQRQRVGIARALYHDPQLLIMDEGTSALDNITEKYIIEAIDRLKGARTVVLIAHRITTVMNCDTIFFMKDGRVTDQGTFAELIERNASFRAMAENVR
jgi:ATP-binding cassette, subfamily B, bacterial PglK